LAEIFRTDVVVVAVCGRGTADVWYTLLVVISIYVFAIVVDTRFGRTCILIITIGIYVAGITFAAQDS